MSQSEKYGELGVIFVSPIIGMPPSLLEAFEPLRDRGIDFEGVDIFDGQDTPRNVRTILGLTMLPRSHERRIRFANGFDEARLFRKMQEKIDTLRGRGRTRIVLGGMSGGFIYASRMAQAPADPELLSSIGPSSPCIAGLFGISPLVSYPAGVTRLAADLTRIPPNVPTALIWADGDHIVPSGTIECCEGISQQRGHIRCCVIHGHEVGVKDGRVRHQFFGGRDFIGPFSNVYFNQRAQDRAIEELLQLIDRSLD